MSKWLGFAVGLIVSVTAVMTLVQPAGLPEDANTQDDAVTTAVAAPPAAATDNAVPESDEATPLRVQALEIPAPAPEKAAEPAAEEAPAAEMAADKQPAPPPEPVAEEIPAFHWDAAPPSGEVQTAAAPEPDVEVLAGPPPVVAQPTEPLTSSAPEPTPAADDFDTSQATNATVPLQDVLATDIVVPPPAPTRQWYAFWQPFGSELSAKGFSARLERVTGLDYRVVKVDGGEYHVAFGYDDEESRLAALSTIEAATGLRLAGKSL